MVIVNVSGDNSFRFSAQEVVLSSFNSNKWGNVLFSQGGNGIRWLGFDSSYQRPALNYK